MCAFVAQTQLPVAFRKKINNNSKVPLQLIISDNKQNMFAHVNQMGLLKMQIHYLPAGGSFGVAEIEVSPVMTVQMLTNTVLSLITGKIKLK